MATTNAVSGGAEEPRQPRPSAQPGFFSVYKSGQGYWTRMGTGIAAALIVAFTIHFLWQYGQLWFSLAFTPASPTVEQSAAASARARTVTIAVCAAVAAGMALLTWRLMNKPYNADFLIATDSEMKKVNWTSRKDLIGSTKVVIGFMFLTAAFLFVVDILFGYFFFFIDVLKASPFGN